MPRPDPKDYPDRVNAFVRAAREYDASVRPITPLENTDVMNTANKNCIRCGYPEANTAHEDCCPDGEAHITADALKQRYDKLFAASKLAFGSLCGAHAADDSVQGHARRVLRGVLQECGWVGSHGQELSATMETVLDETAKKERLACSLAAREFVLPIDGTWPPHDLALIKQTAENIANLLLARSNPPSRPENQTRGVQ